jgi:uncharacterized protein YbjT (DUF2867 family)
MADILAGHGRCIEPKAMRIEVTRSATFPGAHVAEEVRRRGHLRAPAIGEIEVVVHLSAHGVRAALDTAFARGARLFVLLSMAGANPGPPRAALAARGRAEELVRASGLPWVVVRPSTIWGPGDRFTNELAGLLRHLPVVPLPNGATFLAPVHVADVAHAIVDTVEQPSWWERTWSLRGPERLAYAEVVERVAAAIHRDERRRLHVPPWLLRLGVAAPLALPTARAPLLPVEPRRRMTIDALAAYLEEARPREEQLAPG